MSADADSAYGKPWFQRGTHQAEASTGLEPASFPKQTTLPDSQSTPLHPPETHTGRTGATPFHSRMGAYSAALLGDFSRGDFPSLFAGIQARAQRGLADQVTPLRLASHLSVLLVAIAVLVISRVEVPEWDFQLVAMPTAASEAQFGSVTKHVSQLFNTAAGAVDGSMAGAAEALQPQIVPFTIIPDRSRQEISNYTVQAGDTVLAIAARFGLAPETLQWSNSRIEANPDLLSIGDQLRILPINGALHTVRAGDSLSSLASRYKVDVEQIIAYEANNLADANAPLIIGTDLVIPGGVKPFVQTQVVGYSAAAVPVPEGATVGRGNFSWPASGTISQNYWGGHPALDVASRTGAPVTSADAGFVTAAGGGWNGGYGNHAIVDHGNGYVTLYAHMNSVFVRAGESVSAGQQIGTVGNTGNSTGPHLHFEIRYQGYPRNPYSLLP